MWKHPPSNSPVNAVVHRIDRIDTGTEPNYQCVYCKTTVYIDGEHKKRTKHWCQGHCDEITTHEKVRD